MGGGLQRQRGREGRGGGRINIEMSQDIPVFIIFHRYFDTVLTMFTPRSASAANPLPFLLKNGQLGNPSVIRLNRSEAF